MMRGSIAGAGCGIGSGEAPFAIFLPERVGISLPPCKDRETRKILYKQPLRGFRFFRVQFEVACVAAKGGWPSIWRSSDLGV